MSLFVSEDWKSSRSIQQLRELEHRLEKDLTVRGASGDPSERVVFCSASSTFSVQRSYGCLSGVSNASWHKNIATSQALQTIIENFKKSLTELPFWGEEDSKILKNRKLNISIGPSDVTVGQIAQVTEKCWNICAAVRNALQPATGTFLLPSAPEVIHHSMQ